MSCLGLILDWAAVLLPSVLVVGLTRGLKNFVGFIGCHGSLSVMEDLEVVDYSSDRLESTNIWTVPGGGSLENMVEIPRLGLDE